MLSRHVLLLLLLSCLFPGVTRAGTGALSAPVTHANGEELLGGWSGGISPVTVFKGIPFAKPPTGALRWRSPQPHSPRSGQQVATKFKPGCMQGPGGVNWYVGVAEAFGHGPESVGRPDGLSEDCLYLNIWSSDLASDAGLPVMVFVHGGSNSGGWSYEPNYIGDNLAARGVVVVTIAYRLGPFGFFSHPALNNTQGEPVANFALLDIRAAFEWVKLHIGSFGGDPDNITGFGESAGAFDLVDLLLVDLAAGRSETSLFRRQVSQSIGGPVVIRKTLAQEQATGVFLVEHLGLEEPVTAGRLRKIPAEDLLKATGALPDDHYFSAVIDGKTFPRHPLDILRVARTTGVQFIAGSNADEWYMYVDEDVTQEDVRKWVTSNAPAYEDALLAAVAGEPDSRRVLDRLRTAQEMLCPSRYLAQRINETGGQAWVYYFSRQRAGSGGERLGAYHGTELPYVFDQHDDWLPVEEPDRKLTDAVLDYWVQFARKGDPNLAGRPAWPVHSTPGRGVMELGDRIGDMQAVSTDLCEILGPARRAEAEP